MPLVGDERNFIDTHVSGQLCVVFRFLAIPLYDTGLDSWKWERNKMDSI